MLCCRDVNQLSNIWLSNEMFLSRFRLFHIHFSNYWHVMFGKRPIDRWWIIHCITSITYCIISFAPRCCSGQTQSCLPCGQQEQSNGREETMDWDLRHRLLVTSYELSECVSDQTKGVLFTWYLILVGGICCHPSEVCGASNFQCMSVCRFW